MCNTILSCYRGEVPWKYKLLSKFFYFHVFDTWFWTKLYYILPLIYDIFSGFWGGKRSRNKKLDALELFFFHLCLSGTYIESLAKVQLLTSKFDFWLSTALTRALFRGFWGILPYRSIFQGSSWDHMYDVRLANFFLCAVLSCYGPYVSICMYLPFLQIYRGRKFGDFSPKSMGQNGSTCLEKCSFQDPQIEKLFFTH